MKIKNITIVDNGNLGNRLQNYAVQKFIKNEFNVESETIKNEPTLNKKADFIEYFIRIVKFYINKFKDRKVDERKCNFKYFNQKIKFSKYTFNYWKVKKYRDEDVYIVGSDQVWNPKFNRLRDFDLINFTNSPNKIAFSASFGIGELESQYAEKVEKELKKFKAISVREDAGKKIVEELTGRKDVEVLLDPTMLISVEEWDKVSRKPEQLKSEKYILNYFLGELSENRKNEIDRIAKENGCEVINILDEKSPFYTTGPSEFLYLEKHAFLICTDSFHSSVFAILYNKPFIVFEREDKTVSMNSRIETLINKFNLKNRKFEGKITEENLNHDYTEAYKILEKEKEKSINFFKKALEL